MISFLFHYCHKSYSVYSEREFACVSFCLYLMYTDHACLLHLCFLLQYCFATTFLNKHYDSLWRHKISLSLFLVFTTQIRTETKTLNRLLVKSHELVFASKVMKKIFSQVWLINKHLGMGWALWLVKVRFGFVISPTWE